MYTCDNQVQHPRNEWCGLIYSIEEQKVLTQYLLGLILCAQDCLVVQACSDVLWALRSWSKDWKPDQIVVSYPLSSELKNLAKELLFKAKKCHTPHSEAWCSAGDCPSCCAEDLLNKILETKYA